jgi:DNA-binding winged helix-turn-helix (wHTH) protein
MRSYNTNRKVADPMEAESFGADSRTSEAKVTYLRDSSAGLGQHQNSIGSTRMPATWRNGMAELLADIDGLPVLFRVVVKDVPAQVQADFASKNADVHSLLSGTLERVVARMRGSSLRRSVPSEQPLAIVELISSGEPSTALPAPANETVLRVGPIELDLLDRTARRGDRKVDLRPREFQLLKYMMQRSDKLLSRATLFKDVWHYKFVPETNLVDVHMGRLRRKVDGPGEAPMIRNVRGAGFVLSATPISQDLPDERSADLPVGDKSPRSVERMLPRQPITRAATPPTEWTSTPSA